MATSIEIARKKFLEHHDKLREEKRKIIVLDALPPAPVVKCITCRARTMKGTKCPFKAISKDGFCSRHSIKK